MPIYTPEPTPVPEKNPVPLLVFYLIMVGWAVVAAVCCFYLYVIRPIIRMVKQQKETARKAKEYKRQQKKLRQIEKDFLERYKNGLF